MNVWDPADIDATWDQACPQVLVCLPNVAEYIAGKPARTRLVCHLERFASGWAAVHRVTLAGVLPGGVGAVSFAGHHTDTTGAIRPVVVKFADVAASAHEAQGLRLLAAAGLGPEVVASSPGMIVIAKAIPGAPLRAVGANLSDVEFAAVGAMLAELAAISAPDWAVPTREKLAAFYVEICDWAHRADLDVVDAALSTTTGELDTVMRLADGSGCVHGDANGGNVLQSEQRWVLIDPNLSAGGPAWDRIQLASALAVEYDRAFVDMFAVVAPDLVLGDWVALARFRCTYALAYLAANAPERTDEFSGYVRLSVELGAVPPGLH